MVIAVILLSGCGKVKNSDRVLAAATGASTTLATYYEDLATITLDDWQNQRAYNAMLDIPAPPAQRYEERLQGFRRRADLTHAIVLVYQSLQTLRDPKGVAKVTNAGQDLGRAIQSITSLPGVANVPTDKLGSAAAFLVNLQRERDLKRAMNAMTDFADGLVTVFAGEQHTYLNVHAERTATAEHLLELLSQKKLVNPAALLQELHLGAPIASGPDEQAFNAGLAIAKISVNRANLAWECATQHTHNLLVSLAATERAIKKGGSGQLSNLEEETRQAAACIKDHDELIKGRQ